MIVKWNGDGVLAIQPMNRDFKTGQIKKVPGLEDRIATGDMIRLIPGYNDIPEDEWNRARLEVMDRIKSESIQEFGLKDKLDGKNGEKVGVTGSALRRFPPTKATQMVKETFSVETLNDWLKGRPDLEPETRDEVRLRIKQQLESIKLGKDVNEEE